MTREEFEDVVVEAMDSLPEMFKERLRNLAVIVQYHASARQSGRVGHRGGELLGLYEGVPIEHGGGLHTGAMPNRITIFQAAIERTARSRPAMLRCIQETVLHEVGHHFGFTDHDLEEMGY